MKLDNMTVSAKPPRRRSAFAERTGGLMIVLTAAATAANAATYSWTGAGGDGKWSTPANWSPASGYPGMNAADVAQIKEDAEITLAGDAVFRHLYVGTNSPALAAVTLRGGSLAVGGDFGIGSTLGSAPYMPMGELHLESVDVSIGTEAAPSPLYLGYTMSGRNQSTRSVLAQTGGSFSAFLGKTYIGTSAHARSEIKTNRVDLSEVEGGFWCALDDTFIAYEQTECIADILLGEHWTVAFGTPEKPVAFSMAHPTGASQNKSAFWDQPSGSFAAHFSAFRLGYGQVNSPASIASGIMRFGAGTAVDIAASNLYVACGTELTATGRLDAAATENGRLTVAASFQLGCQANGQWRRGELLLGTNWTVCIGSESAPAYECWFSVPNSAKSLCLYESRFTMEGGSFEAYCTNIVVAGTTRDSQYASASEIRLSRLTNAVIRADTLLVGEVSRKTSSSCSASGILDMGDASNIRLDVGTLHVGYTAYTNSYSFSGDSIVRLGSGEGSVGDCVVGNGTRSNCPVYGLLELNGMRLAVTNGLTLGAHGTVTNNVSGAPSGFDISAGVTPILSGRMVINFTRAPEEKFLATPANADGVCWGLAWAGDHAAEVSALIAAGCIAVDTSALASDAAAATGVLYDAATDATYIGFYTRERGPQGTAVIMQ
jgi:hypothetical protein